MIVQRDEMKLQSSFYRNGYHTALRWLFVEIVIMFILIAVSIGLIFSQHAPPYYVTTQGGKIMRLGG